MHGAMNDGVDAALFNPGRLMKTPHSNGKREKVFTKSGEHDIMTLSEYSKHSRELVGESAPEREEQVPERALGLRAWAQARESE